MMTRNLVYWYFLKYVLNWRTFIHLTVQSKSENSFLLAMGPLPGWGARKAENSVTNGMHSVSNDL